LTVSNGLLNTGKIDLLNRGVLNSVSAWTNNGVLNVLAGGRITGGALTNQSNGTITDAGVIDALLVNQGRMNFGGTVSNDLINSGVVQLNNTATITQTANANGGTYNLAGNNLFVGQLNMTAGVFSNTGNARLVLNGNATGNASASTAIITGGILDLAGGTRTFSIADGVATIDMQVSAVVSNGGLVKTGLGTMELTGANKYAGGTTISNGILRVNNATGSGTGTGAVTIETGGTLGGTGSVSGLLTVKAGGTLSPGNSVGTLQLGSLDLNPSSTLQIEIASPTSYDKLTLSGSATLGGDLNLVFLGGYTPGHGDSLTILSAAGGVSGSFDSVTPGYDVALVGNDVILTVLPEPSALALVFLGIFMVGVTARRRK
jgi:autotransporter-associated beta strand protein